MKTSVVVKLLIATFGLLVWNPLLQAQVAFQLSSSPATSYIPYCVVAADVNGDDKPDIIYANYLGSSISVLTNNGNGLLGSNATLNTSDLYMYSVAVADVNGDGKPDLICPYNTGRLIVFTNSGSGIFGSNSGCITPPQWTHTWITTADVNDDGYLDLIAGDFSAGNLRIWTNNGAGVFGIKETLSDIITVTPLKYRSPAWAVVADVNGDGRLDLITANGNDNSLSVSTNELNGVYIYDHRTVLSAGQNPTAVLAVDVNGDGKLDLIAANGGPSSTSIYTNTLTVLTNGLNGTYGSFGYSATIHVGYSPKSLAAADVNGDGKLEVICANNFDNTLTVLTNNGKGNLGSNSTFSAASRPVLVITADVNGDGRLDLICGADPTGAKNISVLTNALTFLPRMSLTRSNNNLLVKWPSVWTGWAGWTLQQNTNLNPANWTAFSGPIGDDGTTKTVTNSTAPGNIFFRLSHP